MACTSCWEVIPLVQGNQYRRADNGGPHGIAEDIERDRNQPRLLEHDARLVNMMVRIP